MALSTYVSSVVSPGGPSYPGFIAGHDLGLSAQALSWSGFVLRNVLPVTIGNVIGGTPAQMVKRQGQ